MADKNSKYTVEIKMTVRKANSADVMAETIQTYNGMDYVQMTATQDFIAQRLVDITDLGYAAAEVIGFNKLDIEGTKALARSKKA